MSACSAFTEHVWKPGECKNCFKPKSLHCLSESSLRKNQAEQRPAVSQQQKHSSGVAGPNANLSSTSSSSQRGGSISARSGHFRPPVAKKPTIAVKPTMMFPCSSAGLDMEGNIHRPPDAGEPRKTSAFTVWNRNGLNRKRPCGSNNNEGEDAREEIEGYVQLSRHAPTGNNNNNGLTDMLKEIAGLSPGPDPSPGLCPGPGPGLGLGLCSGSKDLFFGRISSSYRRSLERGLPASSCLAMGSSGSGGPLQKRVALNDSTEVISTEGGRFCYPEFSSEGEDDNDEDEEEEEEESEENDDGEHESWDESDEELLAVEIRMRGQPRFANFRAATLSPVPFAAGKKWNTVPLRNRSLQRICAVDYDDSYDEILNGYPSMDSNRGHGLLTYGPGDLQSSAFLSHSESTTSPESSSSLPEDSRTTSSSGSSAPSGHRNGLPSQSSSQVHPPQAAAGEREQAHRALSPIKITETHKAVLAIRLEEQEGREGPMPQALPGQPITISFSPTEDQARPYRVVNLEKPLICKPYTVVDVSASMTHKEERTPDSTAKLKTHRIPTSPASPPSSPLTQPLSPAYAMSPTSPISPRSVPPSALGGSAFKKSGNIRYQEVWTSSTSPRQKIPRIDPEMGAAPVVPPRQCSHKSAPTSPISGLSSSRTVPVKSPNLSEIKFNSYNNAGMPLFPIIIRDEPSYARSSKNAVKVPIVINPSAYDNLAVYKSFLGLNGELPQPKGSRVASHTYEEIGSVESVQSSPTDKLPSSKAAVEDRKPTAAPASAPGLTPLEIFSKTTPASSSVPSMDTSATTAALTTSLTLTASLAKGSPNRDMSSREGSTDYPLVPGTGTAHREKAITVLSQIVASIQPPQSPPEPPSAQSQTCSVEELYALPPDATKDSLGRPKSLFSTPDSGLSKLRKDTPSKQLPKSQSASATVTLSSPKAEPSAPFPPPRSTSSPFHASNILQRHFGNWAKPASSSPTRPSDGESSPGGGEGRRGGAESTKPKRWISFKSFFRRRKDEEDQREKAEKDKGKTLGLDGTVIHMLPPPPIQRHHWFSEAKPDDPSQKPTIIFTYKPDCSASGDGEGELRVEESRETTLSAPEDSMGTRTLSPEQTLSPGQTLSPEQITSPQAPETDPPSHIISELPDRANEGTMPTAACRLAQLQLGSVGETCPPASDGSASVGDPDEDGNHSHSPASSTCSATYSNLGPSRANMIPLKQPRNMKSSFDTLASLDLDGPQDQPGPQATPPPLPKKCVPRSTTEPSSLAMPHGALKPKAEAKPGGSNLSVANPLYDLDCTWETTSQSSSLSSETRPHEQESGDSLERPVTGINKGRPANSLSCLASAPSATTGREHRGCRSAESLAGRTRTTGRGPGGRGSSKPQRQVLYRGMDSWEEVVGRIRGLHTETLRKLAVKCEDRFMAGLKEHLRFGNDSWSHFRLTTGTPCCEAGDAVYYTASYAKDPLVSYAIKICRSKVKETQQQFFHSLAVRQSLALHFNIQQDCGHFLADVPARLLPWEEEEEEEEDDEGEEEEQKTKNKETKTEKVGESDATSSNTTHNGQSDESHVMSHMGTTGQLRSRVVVITREVPFQTVADFVQEGEVRHARNPDLYERQVCLLLLQLCSGLEHMKPYHVTHCDLRLENLLLVHCQPGPPANPGQVEANNNTASSATGLSTAPCGTGLSTAPSGTGLTTAPSGTGLSTAPCGTGLTTATSAASVAANATCPARLIISNFSQAKQKTPLVVDPGALRNQSRLAPEIVTATQYRKCDEFQTGILIYEMLHQPNPFEETPDLKEREYTWADLPPLPVRSLYSQGLQQLASLLLTVNPSERIQMAEARACLQCLLWGPREDLFQVLNSAPAQGSGPGQRETTLQNWLDLKRTLMMIKFAERSLDSACGVSLEDWLCCQYLAFATTDSLSRVVHILQQTQAQPQPQPQPQPQAQPQPQPQAKHQTHPFHVTQSQPL